MPSNDPTIHSFMGVSLSNRCSKTDAKIFIVLRLLVCRHLSDRAIRCQKIRSDTV